MKKNYIGVIKEEKGVFGVIFPDFLGCVSNGETLEDAVKYGQEALELHLEGMAEDKLPIPEESDLSLIAEWIKNSDNSILHWFEVNLDQPKVKTKKINITIPEDILNELNNKFEGRLNKRSSFIANVLKRELELYQN